MCEYTVGPSPESINGRQASNHMCLHQGRNRRGERQGGGEIWDTILALEIMDSSEEEEMVNPKTKPVDVERAKAIWADYQTKHDVSNLKGQYAVIEPKSGRVWIDETPLSVADKMHADGCYDPAYAIMVGYDYFVRKGRR